MRKLRDPSATSQLLPEKLSKIINCLFPQHLQLENDKEEEAGVENDESFPSFFPVKIAAEWVQTSGSTHVIQITKFVKWHEKDL